MSSSCSLTYDSHLTGKCLKSGSCSLTYDSAELFKSPEAQGQEGEGARPRLPNYAVIFKQKKQCKIGLSKQEIVVIFVRKS
jgi:hypothetical protein